MITWIDVFGIIGVCFSMVCGMFLGLWAADKVIDWWK